MLTFLLLMKHIFVNVFNMCLVFIKIQYAAVKVLGDLIRRPTHLGKAQGQREVRAGRRGSSISVQPACYCYPHDGTWNSLLPKSILIPTALQLSFSVHVHVFSKPRRLLSLLIPTFLRAGSNQLATVHESLGAQPLLLLQALLHSTSSLKLPLAARLAPPHSDHCCAPPRRQVPHSETLSALQFWASLLFHSCVAFCLMLRFQVDCQLKDGEASVLLFLHLRGNGSLMHAVWCAIHI